MARQAGVQIDDDREEVIELFDENDGSGTRFHVPEVKLSYSDAAELNSGTLE
jgi:hypothetical protein